MPYVLEPVPVVNMSKAPIARAVLEKLQAQGFSQHEIGRRTGISRGQVFNILSGRTGIGKQSVKRALESKTIKDEMLLLRDFGGVWVEPANWKQRQWIGQHWNAVKDAREKGDWSGLENLKNRRVLVIDKGKRQYLSLVTDPEMIKKLEDAGELEPVEIAYKHATRARGKKA
jgi:transcriptional regulator with XRE-family HTH domain